ncbi:hypothetical protein [Paludisphaera rhizosphaerae]|uniref:hypothetical protein n=1 Tax=Paludisphaera rhizosphaerae TaxID=2711216 RepID=UPI0013EB0A20|nr:hypothetical protein [Paludisphaera rhizosphaerae]
MTIHLSKDLAQFVHEVVRAGRYATEAQVVEDALERLRVTMPPEEQATSNERNAAKASLHRRLMEMGLMTQPAEASSDLDDPEDRPIEIEGEPLSADIIRERR